MAKKVLTNVDLLGNSLMNLVVGSLSQDPSNVSNGYMYYNSVSGHLRAFLNGTWKDLVSTPDGMTLKVVESLPDARNADANTLYLLLRSYDVCTGYNTYRAYWWTGSGYAQVSGYDPEWSEVRDKPLFLDASIIDISGSESDKVLKLYYDIR